jgi:zinc protease
MQSNPASARPRRNAQARVLLAAWAALAFASNAQSDETTVNGIIPYPAHVQTLDNGLKVIVMPMPSNGLVSYWSIVRTGSRDEYEPGRTGFAHFFEHMMFRGTERFPSEVYQRILTEIGADGNAYTSDDLTAYHISMTAQDLDRVMELESDRFQRLLYSEQDFQTEAGAVYGEYRKNRTNPLFVLYEALIGAAFQTHTYGHTTIGYEQDIAAMPRMYDYSRAFFSRHYRPDNIILLVVGDVEPEPVFAQVEKYYGEWPSGYAAPEIPAEPAQREERRIEVEYDGQTLPLLWVAYKIGRFDPGNRLRVAADLLAELAFGATSNAYRRLVLDEQVVEFLQAEANLNRDPGRLDIYTRIKDPAKVDYVLEVIDETIATYRTEPLEPSRLEALKARLRYGFVMNLDTPDAVAQRLARPIAISGGLDAVEALYSNYAATTAEEVQTAAETYFVPERRTVGVLRAGQ